MPKDTKRTRGAKKSVRNVHTASEKKAHEARLQRTRITAIQQIMCAVALLITYTTAEIEEGTAMSTADYEEWLYSVQTIGFYMCIMPFEDIRGLMSRAIQCFIEQDTVTTDDEERLLPEAE